MLLNRDICSVIDSFLVHQFCIYCGEPALFYRGDKIRVFDSEMKYKTHIQFPLCANHFVMIGLFVHIDLHMQSTIFYIHCDFVMNNFPHIWNPLFAAHRIVSSKALLIGCIWRI